MRPTSILITATGRDRPGVTASFFDSLAEHDADIVDVEQVVVRERLILAVLIELRGDPWALRRSVSRTAQALGMDCDVLVGTDEARPERRPSRSGRSHVIMLGYPLRPGSISDVAHRIGDVGGTIESVTQLSRLPASSLELLVSSADPAALRSALVLAAEETGLDIAVEPAGLRRRAKRLVVLDFDSTLIQDEGIDALAAAAGRSRDVEAIMDRAMNGELEYADSLRQRVALLAGLPYPRVEQVRDGLRLTPGADRSVRTLRRLGYHVGVVSGGFTVFTDRFVAELGLEFAAANELDVVDGRLTGHVVEPVLDRVGKAEALRQFAERFDVPLSQTVAVGDGANDIEMLELAGLGIAFNGRAALRAPADASVTQPFLDSVLFILGISGDEIDEVDAMDRARYAGSRD
jgi:phosphoserine phosphatase